ncbi:MAG: ATP-binding protein [Spirulina sp. SIO3F2]|nr:ATP-binding protein [Spirulina sp. SIO3F2]
MSQIQHTDHSTWQQINRQYLLGALRDIQVAITRNGHPASKAMPERPETSDLLCLPRLCQTFNLSDFERDVLVLCAGMEVLGDWGDLCARANGNPKQTYPTLSLAVEALGNSEWQALIPTAPLRHWRLLEIGEGQVLTQSPLRIDEQILHYLMGIQHLEQRLAIMLDPVQAEASLVQSHATIANRIVQIWQQAQGRLPIIQLWGANEQIKRAIAHQVAQQIQTSLFALSTEFLASQSDSLNLTQRLIEREWRLNRAMLLLDFGYTDKSSMAVQRLIDTLQAPLILSTTLRYSQHHRPIITFEVEAPTAIEQQQIWMTRLGHSAVTADGQVQRLISNFNLTPGQIQSACLTLGGSEAQDFETLWEICRTQSRPRLDELAQRVEVGAHWSDLVLPEREQQVLQAIAAQVEQRLRVYQDWGFGNSKKRGLGITALFAGASGTGKTMAAEAIASELNLDVYRIDLSSIISKYIGETEKNLRKLFDAAESGGVILLFDEADALFGKRSEVRDSHDRHANVEVAYLLQRMETFQGLAILTTNLKSSLDQAFLRRIRFVINFPFPKAPQRAEIWRRVFPQQTPTQKLDYELLAQLEVAGGNIKSIAMNAAFIAAKADEPIQMKHLLQAARSEYIKIEKVLTDTEIRDWVD